jgi:U2 small nuclear ribonucleoprotein B''
MSDEERHAKREKADDDEEEMEIDEEEEQAAANNMPSMTCYFSPCIICFTLALEDTIPAPVQQVTQRLLCTNLPQEVTDDVLSVLFSQCVVPLHDSASFINSPPRYQGFQNTHVVQSPTPNAAGAKVKMAQVLFDTPDLASTAKEALDGFTLKKGWLMAVAYI